MLYMVWWSMTVNVIYRSAIGMVIIVVMNIFQIFAIIGLIQVEWPEEVEAIFKESTIFILEPWSA